MKARWFVVKPAKKQLALPAYKIVKSMEPFSIKRKKRKLRHRRVRSQVQGTKETPRVSVFRSNQHISAQLINDEVANTLLNFTDSQLSKQTTKGKNKTEIAFLMGKEFGEQIKKAGIKTIVFDRGGCAYHGRVKALAEGIREAGIKF